MARSRTHPDGRAALYAIWAEGVAVAEAEGVELDEVLDVEPQELSTATTPRWRG